MPRLFVGVELDDPARLAAAAVVSAFRSDLSRAGIQVDARWVPAENLHITLWFIGEVDDGRGGAVHAALSPPIPGTAFDIELEGVGAFPQSGPPRVFWIGVGAGAERVRSLYATVGARLAPLGFEPERRPYAAHLTIARVKALTRRSDATALRRVMLDASRRIGRSHVGAVTLFRSRLSPKGATYEPLLRVPLE